MIEAALRRQDLLLAVAMAIALSAEILTSSAVDGAPWLTLALLLPSAAALAVRRRAPLVPMLAILVGYSLSGFLATDIIDLSATLPMALLAGYAVGRYAADVRPGAAAAALTIVLANLAASGTTADDWVFPLVVFGVAILTGRALRTRARVAAELAERTERLAVEQELLAAEAAIDERRRIARELHDVVAHTLSVMVVQAGAARVTVARDAARAEEALRTVETTGREALGELRRMLGFVGDGADAPLQPQPTVAEIEGLARRAGAAGLPTAYVVEGTPGPLPVGVEMAAFRIAQEGLTNALKHAGPGATATLVVRWLPEALEVEVADDGGTADETRALPSGGHGLVGMRERVALFGGALEAAPRPGGGFRVRARLPRGAAVAVPA